VLPALYILMAAWICVVLLRYKPQYTWPGLILVLLGSPGLSVPVYYVLDPQLFSENLSSGRKRA
jgi:hypothetical protein